MDAFFQELFNLVVTPPGNLTYHLVLVFSLAGALQSAYPHWRASQFPQSRRTVIGLSLLLLLRLGMFTMAGIAWQGLLSEHLLLPPVDRAINLLSLTLIIWLWVFPEPQKLADAATWLLALLTATLAGLTLAWWMEQGNRLSYNGSWPDFIGEVAAIGLLLLGIFFLLARKPNGWGFGLGMLGLMLTGHLAYLNLPLPSGDFAGVIRLAHMAAYPILLALPQRFPSATFRPPEPATEPQRLRLAADPKHLEAYLALAGGNEPDEISRAIPGAVAQALLADLCLLVSTPDQRGDITIYSGYDLIRETHLPGGNLPGAQMPMVTSALSQGLPLRLPASSTSTDLHVLGQSLHLAQTGHLLLAPLIAEDGKPLASLMLLSPYSNRTWNDEDQALLGLFTRPLARLLQRTQRLAFLENELSQAQQQLENLQQVEQRLQRENERLQAQLLEAQQENEKNRSQAEALAALVAAQGAPAQDVAPLLKETSAEQEQLEGELRLALEEVARLKAALYEADQKYLTLKNQGAEGLPTSEILKEVSTIIQDLRQPISSILGYTDFLLGESIGILGALQRKFLERIKISSERLNRLVNDLLRLTAAEKEGRPLFKPGVVDAYSVVDEAIAESMDEIRRKNLNLQVDMPEGLPPLRTDHDALKQVLVHLIENARMASPQNSNITLRARTQSIEPQQEYVLFQVIDQGGGIPPEYLPRLFSRFGYADGKPIPGTGLKSASLSIVKMLVENLGGRIWVDSEANSGSTFSILLPVMREEAANTAPGIDV